MKTIDLNGLWVLQDCNGKCWNAHIPGSVYSTLLENGAMDDPYYRDNELQALELMKQDYVFSRSFSCDPQWMGSTKLLRCEGLDTICTVQVNGQTVGKADNMHRIWEFDVTHAIKPGENTLSIQFESPIRWIKNALQKDFIGGSQHAMAGFPHMRKAHCMFGWDWGPRLPDAGIWRNISLVIQDSSRIVDFRVEQEHRENGEVWLTPHICQTENADISLYIQAPDGTCSVLKNDVPYQVQSPQLWWPNGYGDQPLYQVEAQLLENGNVVDRRSLRIGLRTMTVVREKDEWGESFAQCVNGVCFFAMGADYIPEDNLLSRVTPERTRKLLEQCVAANFNSIRVWGGGYYPDDFFFDICDELGLVVWQDFMFACANYHLTEEFEANIRAEFADNIRRLRHHPSLGLWCGNNEMEMFQASGEYCGTPKTRSDYIRMFEHIIPKELKKHDPNTFYWPASPSSGGSFDAPNDPNRGDVHYWDVWHGEKPFAEYRKFFFRYASEFGFQSFPCMKTIESFTLPEDRNIFSRVMEMHQRNEGANGKIMNYLSQTFLYPTSLDTLVYASQLLQAEAIRYGVEHWRRNRGRCMGAIYWQLNDIWPVASWASIDYYGRWKALHYYAKRFFAPWMISCEEIGETTNRLSVVTEPSKIETSARLCVANETRVSGQVEVRWQLRNAAADILQEGSWSLEVPALSSVWCDKLDFDGTDFLENYFSYQLYRDGQCVSSGTVLFTAPKHYHFRNPNLTWKREGNSLTISADAFAKSVEISSPDCDLILSDNYFDLNAGSRSIEILESDPQTITLKSVYDIR